MSGRRSWTEHLTIPHHTSRQSAGWVSPADQTEYTLGLLGAGVDLAAHEDLLVAGLASYAGDLRTRARALGAPPHDRGAVLMPVLAISDLRSTGGAGATLITITAHSPHRRGGRGGRGRRRSVAVAASVAALVLAMSGTALAVVGHHGNAGLSTGPDEPTAASAASAEMNDLLAHASYLLTAAVGAAPSQQAALRGEASQDLSHARSLLPEVPPGQTDFTATLATLQGRTGLPAAPGGTSSTVSTVPKKHPGATSARPTTRLSTFPYRGNFSFDNPAVHGHLPSGHVVIEPGKGDSTWTRVPESRATPGATPAP